MTINEKLVHRNKYDEFKDDAKSRLERLEAEIEDMSGNYGQFKKDLAIHNNHWINELKKTEDYATDLQQRLQRSTVQVNALRDE